jgi:glycosyltransferase involved in cell wall biosynthesis
VTSDQTTQPQETSPVSQAVEYMQQGQNEQARSILETLAGQELVAFEVTYMLAFLYHQAGLHQLALDMGARSLAAIQNEETPADVTDARSNVDELCLTLGNSALALQRVDTAQQVFEQGLAFSNTNPVLYQNLGVLFMQAGQTDAAQKILEHGCAACPEDNEMCRMLGVVLGQSFEYGAAWMQLNRAVETGSVEALYDAARHAMIIARPHDARDLLDRYCAEIPPTTEVRALRDQILSDPRLQLTKVPTITVAMIVKNEEEMLGQCLTSIRDLWDELIVVDTGSDDRTVEIAESYGAQVFHHPWNDSFSEARNHSLDHSTGDWILYIDADEELVREDIPKLLAMKWDQAVDAICLGVYSALPGHLGSARGKHYYPRFFKRQPDIRFTGIVHNLLELDGKKTSMSEVRILHYGYDLDKDAMAKKFERSLALLLKQVEDMPEDPFVRYNTAQMLLSRNHTQEAQPHAEKILDVLGPDSKDQQHLFLMAHFQLALIHSREGNLDKAEYHCREALKYKPDYIDPMNVLGLLLAHKGEFEEARSLMFQFLETCEHLKTEGDYNLLILNKLGSDYEVYYTLGEIEFKESNFEKAQEYLEKSLDSNEYYWRPYALLASMALETQNWESAAVAGEAGIKCAFLNAEKYGSLGAQHSEFRDMLQNYQTALTECAKSSNRIEGLDDALASIDELLDKKD